MSNEPDVLLTYDNKSIIRVVVVVIDHHKNNRSYPVLTTTVDPNKLYYFETKLGQPSLANLMHLLLGYGMIH